MSTVENIDSILDVPYGELSKKEIEYCISVISMKKHEVIYNTSTKLYLKMAKHALASELWYTCSKCCRYVTYMIYNYKVDRALECELYLIYGYLISKTPYSLSDTIQKKKLTVIYMNKLKNDAEALKNAMLGFRMAVQIKNNELIINFTVFIWHLMEKWLNISREFSYIFYFILKAFDEKIIEINHENKKWAMFIKYETTKCLMDIKRYNYDLQKIKIKNTGKVNMDIDFDLNDTTIFPENSYLKSIIINVNEDFRLLLHLFIRSTLSALNNINISELIMKNIKEIASLAKQYDKENFLDFVDLYVKFVLANFKKPDTTKYINEMVAEFKLNENDKIYVSIIKCFKKLPLKPEKINKMYKKISKFYSSIIDIEEEGNTVTFDSYKTTPQNYFVDLAYLSLLSKNYKKARSILSEVKFYGYTSRTLILKKKLFELYLDLDEFLANPTLLLLSTESIDFQLDKMKKMKELIFTYEKQYGDKNFTQKAVQSMWNYMFPLLQQRLYPKIKPYVEFLHKTLERIDSPLFILRSAIGKELAKICEYDLEYTRAFKYLKKAYLIVNDYNGLLKSNTYHLLNLKLSCQQKDFNVEEKLYLTIEDIRKSHYSIPDAELENTLKIYLYDFTNVKRSMEVEEIILKKYNPEYYQLRYIKDFNTINRCKTTMTTLLKIIDLAFQRKLYSITFDVASIVIFNSWDKSFSETEYFKISLAHVSHIHAYIILHYWKLFKNRKDLKKLNSNDKSSDHTKYLMDKQKPELEELRSISSEQAIAEVKIDEDDIDKNSTKFYDYYENRKNSLPYKEKLMEDVLRAINIGLEIDKQWIVNNSASIIYDFILIQSKTIINGSKDCLFMGYFDEIKILYEKIKLSKEKSSLLYIYICAVYMQANIEIIEFELYGEIKVTNSQRKLLENINTQPKNLNNYFAVVKEIYNFFITSNFNLDNYISMTISSLWIRYKQAKTDDENLGKELEKSSLFLVDSLENTKGTSNSDYMKAFTSILNDYLAKEKNLTLSNWVEGLVRIGRCALREKLYNYALKCFDSAFKETIPTDIDSPLYKNKYDANICFYWTSIGYFESANVYQEYIAINYIITDIPTMHLQSMNYLVESSKYLRLQSNFSYELFLEISKRVWNIAIQLLKYKTTYKQLEKLLYELVFVTNRITTEQKKFKENFKDPESKIVKIFSQIFSLILELNLLNKNWTSGLHIIAKLNALLPINIDNNCYLEKLQFFYHTNNEMGLNSLFISKPELQLFYWTNIAFMEGTGKEQAEHAYKTCIDLCEDPNKKAEYIIKYVDWMNTNHVDKKNCLDYLCKAWDLIDPTISEKVKQSSDKINSKEIYIDENKIYSVYHVEILVRSFILYLAIHHTKKNSLNCIHTIYKLLINMISNTYNTALFLQNEYNKKKYKKADTDESANTKENKGDGKENNNNKKKGKEKKEKKKVKKNSGDHQNQEDSLKDYYYISIIPELPVNVKNWPQYVWPNTMYSMLEDSDSDSVLIKRNIKSSLSLICAIYSTIEECISLLRFNYVYFFLWLINTLINNFTVTSEKYIIKCISAAIDFHIYNMLDEKGISFDRYYALTKHFSTVNTEIGILSKKRTYSIDNLDIFNDFLFDNSSNLVRIIEIFVMNKEIVDVNKMKSIIKQIEERTPIQNKTIMCELIYCKLVINDYINSYDYSEMEYTDLCKIGLNLNCNIKMKYKIANCYLKYISRHSCSYEEFEKAGQFVLSILAKSGSSDDWTTHEVIGKLHQNIGSILGNFSLKCDDQNKIFKLAYNHFIEALNIFESNDLLFSKASLIVDFIKIIYCHLYYNKIWSKNLLLICLCLIKESQLALDSYKNNSDGMEITDTKEYKNCVDLITVLEIELYIIINKFDSITLYEENSIKNMISNYIIDSYIPAGVDEKYAFIKQITMEEAKNVCLSLKECLNQGDSKNIHILFLYGIIQCLNSDIKEQRSVVDLNNITFKKTLKIGDYYNKELKIDNSIRSLSSFLDLNLDLTVEEERFFTNFFHNWDLSLLNSITEKYQSTKTLENKQLIDQVDKVDKEEKEMKMEMEKEEDEKEKEKEIENVNDNKYENENENGNKNENGNGCGNENENENENENGNGNENRDENEENNNKEEKDNEEERNKQLPKLETSNNVLCSVASLSPTKQEFKNIINNEIPKSISMIECFKNVISIGLASLDYKYVQLCSEYLYKLINDDLSLKFGYLSLLQNCIYSNIYKEILLKTTNPIYKYSYIKNILKEQNNQNKEYYIENNITLGWKRYVISKNYLTDFKSVPSGIDILILQHSLDKKTLYTGLINKDENQGKSNEKSHGKSKEGNQGKAKEGTAKFDFFEYEVNYQDWKEILDGFNEIIEKYEIDSTMLDYFIKKEYKIRKGIDKGELLKQQEPMQAVKEGEKTETKKNKKSKKTENEDIKTKSEQNAIEANVEMEKVIEMKIKENIPEKIISMFQNYISKIIDYLIPIFEHYQKVNNGNDKKKMKDKKDNKDKNNTSEKDEKQKYNLIICCDESFLILPLSLIFNLFSSWDIIYKEFSFNMLLHRFNEQFIFEKESQNQKFAEVNYLNCMVNIDKDNFVKKGKSETTADILIDNINELKNILSSNNILNKWPGSYFTNIQTAQLQNYFSPPGFLYMSSKHLFDEIPLNKFNFNLSGINHAILFENISIYKFKTKVYKLDIKETVQTIMLLSLYGINNVYYQPYLVDLNTNEILLDTIFKCHGVPLNEVLLNLNNQSKIPISCCECFGLPTSLRIKVDKKENSK